MKRPSPLAAVCAAVFLLWSPLVPGYSQEKPDALRIYRQARDMEAQGRTAEAMLRYDEAVTICKDEISQNATNMDSYTVLTWALLRQRKYAEVTEWGAKGLKVNPNDYRVVETMGEAYFYLNNFKESLKYMQKYVDSTPQGDRVSVAYFFIGEVFRLQQRFKHADISYTMAVRLEPNLSLWWYRLGSVRESAGEFPSAVEAYERALKLNPGYNDALEGLERAKKKLG